MKNRTQRAGFSLIELMVASALFLTVVAVATSAFVSILDASAQNRELGVLMSNLDFALEDMSRNIRTGDSYRVAGTSRDILYLETYIEGGTQKCWIEYKLLNGSIQKSKDKTISDCSGYDIAPITSPEINIEKLQFEIDSNGGVQPRVIINVSGKIQGTIEQDFRLQTSVTQRILDYED